MIQPTVSKHWRK